MNSGREKSLVEGENGFLVPIKDVEDLKTAIEELIQDDEKRERMGERSRELVEERFSSKKVVQEYLTLYEELFSRENLI